MPKFTIVEGFIDTIKYDKMAFTCNNIYRDRKNHNH